jgi:hypothetical protein
MKARDQWTELLNCPNCGRSGVTQLSQPDGHAYDMSVDAVPLGFKVVSAEFGEIFYCRACDCEASTKINPPVLAAFDHSFK